MSCTNRPNVKFIKMASIKPCIVGGGSVSGVNANEEPCERALRLVIAKQLLGINTPELLEFKANEFNCITLPALLTDMNMDPHYVGKDMFGRIDLSNDTDHTDIAELQIECKDRQPLNVDLSVRSIADQIDVIVRSGIGKPKTTRKYCIDWRTD